ncbi:MAG: class I SAM-dependent methyltransferase [Candidatus Margulisiibacteriota bacterium]
MTNNLNITLIKETKLILAFLKEYKDKLDAMDKADVQKDAEAYLLTIFPGFKKTMDEHFSKTSSIFDNIKDKTEYKDNQDYYIKTLWDYLYFPKINKHIYDKPFGYPGDFVLMNYIIDYQDKFIGESSFEKLINYYSVKSPFCLSNVARKEYLKSIIISTISRYKSPGITSVASGSIRELLDISGEHPHINEFNCIDFEPKAFEYIKNELKRDSFNNKIKMNFILKDIIKMIKTRDIGSLLKPQDLIYFSGIFDYLPDRIAKKVFTTFYSLLKDGGTMLICNCSKKNKKLHSYYEVLGKWEMIYRDEDDLIDIISDAHVKKHRFDYPKNGKCYNFLVIEK